MYDKKLAIALTAKDLTGRAFNTLQGRIAGITKKVFSLQGAFVATAAAAGMGYFIKKSLDAADAIGKTADRIGVTTDALQEYRHAAELSGIQQSTMDKGLEAFTKRLGEARAGTGALVTYLNSYNKTLLQSVQNAGSTEDALKLIFGAMENMTSASDKAALSAAAFSRTAGVQMVNMMRDGTDGLNSMLQEARDLGLVIDESLIRNSEKANDALTKVNSIIKVQLTSTFVELAPTITNVADQMSSWVKANRDLIDQKMTATIDGLATAFTSFASAVATASNAYGKFVDIFYGPTSGDPKQLAKQGLEKQLELSLRSYELMVQQGNIGEETLKLAESRILTLRQRIQILEDQIEIGGIKPSGAAGSVIHTAAAVAGGVTQETMEAALGNSREYYDQMKEQLFSFHDVALAEAQAKQQEEMDYEAGHFRRMIDQLGGYHDARLEIMQAQQAQELAMQAHEKAMQAQRVKMYQDAAGGIANTFLQISQAGGKQSKEAFKVYKAFAMTEAAIAGYKAVLQAMSAYPPPYSFIMAGIAGAAAATQIGLIAAAKPPSYDQGGISRTPGMYYSGVPEAHVPLKGGAIPVNLGGGNGGGDTFIIMENPVFQDLETQQAVFAQIAEQIAPNAVVRAYDNDHTIRRRIRSRM